MAICAVLGTLLPAIYGLLVGIQDPVVHDEYGYLLGADTFASGRLTNPPPDLPRFFESEHILVTPTYQSKYPPAQSLALAAGQVLMRHPIWGVWLTCGLFAASLMWMLQSWTSPHYAFAVTVGTIITVGTTTYWAQSYWGGMLGATGAAIVFGALRRTVRTPRVPTSILLAFGVLLLANARPFEGLLATLPAALVMIWWLLRHRSHSAADKLKRVVVPTACVLLLGVGWMATYNRAVTGDALRSPYALHIDQYLYRGVLVFSPFRVPERMAPDRVDKFYKELAGEPVTGGKIAAEVGKNVMTRLPLSVGASLGLFATPERQSAAYRGVLVWVLLLPAVWMRRSLSSFGIIALSVAAVELLVCYFVPFYPFALVPIVLVTLLITFDWRLPDNSWSYFALSIVLLVTFGQALVPWWLPHYPAPFYPMVLALWAAALHQYSVRMHVPETRIPHSIVVIVLLVQTVAVALWAREGRHVPAAKGQYETREQVRRTLVGQGGRHLIFVRYEERYSVHREWVYNDADLLNTPVLFAHDLGNSENQLLISANPNRTVWRLAVALERVQLESYR